MSSPSITTNKNQWLMDVDGLRLVLVNDGWWILVPNSCLIVVNKVPYSHAIANVCWKRLIATAQIEMKCCCLDPAPKPHLQTTPRYCTKHDQNSTETEHSHPPKIGVGCTMIIVGFKHSSTITVIMLISITDDIFVLTATTASYWMVNGGIHDGHYTVYIRPTMLSWMAISFSEASHGSWAWLIFILGGTNCIQQLDRRCKVIQSLRTKKNQKSPQQQWSSIIGDRQHLSTNCWFLSALINIAYNQW